MSVSENGKRTPQEIPLLDTSLIQKIEIWGREEWTVEKNGDEVYLNFYIPIVFDANKAFGLNVCTDETGGYIDLYLNWYPQSEKIELVLCCMAQDTSEAYNVKLDAEQADALHSALPELCEIAYGYTPRELWENAVKEGFINEN